jgi:hypothetical protein
MIFLCVESVIETEVWVDTTRSRILYPPLLRQFPWSWMQATNQLQLFEKVPLQSHNKCGKRGRRRRTVYCRNMIKLQGVRIMYTSPNVCGSISEHWQLRSQSSAPEAGQAFATVDRSDRGPHLQGSGPHETRFPQASSESPPQIGWEGWMGIW